MTCRQEKSLGLKLNYPADKYCELKKNKGESVELWETWLDIHASGVFSTSNNTLFNTTCDVLRHILQFSRNPIFFYLKDISGNVPLTSYLSSKDIIFHGWLIQVPLRENYPYLSFSVPYFLAFGLNTEWYSIFIRPKKNSEYGHFSPVLLNEISSCQTQFYDNFKELLHVWTIKWKFCTNPVLCLNLNFDLFKGCHHIKRFY